MVDSEGELEQGRQHVPGSGTHVGGAVKYLSGEVVVATYKVNGSHFMRQPRRSTLEALLQLPDMGTKANR